MNTPHKRSHAGFTLVEILLIVTIIGLLASIAIPNFLRARMRSQATLILQDLRMIDVALANYALENNKKENDAANWTDVQRYIKEGTKLAESGGFDVFGNPYYVSAVGGDIELSDATYRALSVIAPRDFWSPFLIHAP